VGDHVQVAEPARGQYPRRQAVKDPFDREKMIWSGIQLKDILGFGQLLNINDLSHDRQGEPGKSQMKLIGGVICT
jgi:hypothetical protein